MLQSVAGERSWTGTRQVHTTVPVMRGAVSDNLNMIMGSGDEETLKIYEILREIQSLRHDVREQQWTLDEKYQHEARGHAEHDDGCEECEQVREQWCDNDVEQVNIDLRHRVTEPQDENRELRQQVGELRRVEQKVRDEKKAVLKAKTLEFHQELDWQLEQNDADRIRLESEKKSLQREVQELCALKEKDLRDQCVRLQREIVERKTKESLDAALFNEITDQSAKQIADLKAENTRLKVCAETSTADEIVCARSSMGVALLRWGSR